MHQFRIVLYLIVFNFEYISQLWASDTKKNEGKNREKDDAGGERKRELCMKKMKNKSKHFKRIMCTE